MKIYFAGPDVFLKDANGHFDKVRNECGALGVEPLIPTDNSIPSSSLSDHSEEAARWLCLANLAMIRESDRVVANLTSFRGTEPDSGTAFEVGYAVAYGKPVHVYTSDTHGEYKDHPLLQYLKESDTVEDFGLPFNLMLSGTASSVSRTLQEALLRATGK